MEHVFLGSKDHVSIDFALRRAELIGLGANDELVETILATRMGIDFSDYAFWRTSWQFLIANSDAIEWAQIGPIVDFLYSVRQDRLVVETANGIVFREPSRPNFSLHGRTLRSLLRLVDQWHRGLAKLCGDLSWPPSTLRPMAVDIPQDPADPPAAWILAELTNSEQLRAEGAALRHCAATYAQRCSSGVARIWSLRLRREERVRSVVTIEVDPRKRAIVQARGFRNRPPSGRGLLVLQQWAAREGLRMVDRRHVRRRSSPDSAW